jgi:hypothetical protein
MTGTQVTRPAGGGATRPLLLFAVFGLFASSGLAADIGGPCFDLRGTVVTPLSTPIALLPGQDNHTFGSYPNGVGWAAGRAVLDVPIESVLARLLDHRNVKDMTKTTLTTTVVDRPEYLAFHLVDIVVTLKALFVKLALPWTEAWAFSLVDGSPLSPRRIVVSYQKVAGTGHIERECGSYVLQARDDGTTDLSLYEEVKAVRRRPEDTLNMHRGILRNLRRSDAATGPVRPAVATRPPG